MIENQLSNIKKGKTMEENLMMKKSYKFSLQIIKVYKFLSILKNGQQYAK